MGWLNKKGDKVGKFYVGQRVEIINHDEYKDIKGFIAAIYTIDGVKLDRTVVCPDKGSNKDVYWENKGYNNEYGDAPRITGDFIYENQLKILGTKIDKDGNLA